MSHSIKRAQSWWLAVRAYSCFIFRDTCITLCIKTRWLRTLFSVDRWPLLILTAVLLILLLANTALALHNTLGNPLLTNVFSLSSSVIILCNDYWLRTVLVKISRDPLSSIVLNYAHPLIFKSHSWQIFIINYLESIMRSEGVSLRSLRDLAVSWLIPPKWWARILYSSFQLRMLDVHL